MPHRTGPSPGNHTTWVELLLAPLPVKWTGNVSCHVQIHSRRGFGVGASIDDQATEDQHRRSGHSLCMGTQLTHGQNISCQSSGGRFLRLHGRFDTQKASCRQRQQLGTTRHGHTRCSASLHANTPGQAGPAPSQRTAEGTATRGKTIQEQIDRLTAEVGPPETILPQNTEHEVVEIPESIPASQDTVIFSPSGRPLLDQDERFPRRATRRSSIGPGD